MKSAFIIAEAGVNHNGDFKQAQRLVDLAKESGADAVKFQSFRAGALVTEQAQKAVYQKKNSNPRESQYQMLKKLELSEDQHRMLKVYCQRRKIIFLSSPFDLQSLEFLLDLGVSKVKLASSEINHLPLLRKAGASGKEIILSTGMAELKEVKQAISVLVASGLAKEKITVLHCHTQYPTVPEDVNLLAIPTMKKELGVKVGFSDHTMGIEFSVAAVALGAVMIEKHLTSDRRLEGPDHQASLEPKEFKQMVTAIRNICRGMGDGIKRPSRRELVIRKVARKSIVAAFDIRKGDVFSEENLTIKRPEQGLSPMLWDRVLNRVAKKGFKKDDFIEV